MNTTIGGEFFRLKSTKIDWNEFFELDGLFNNAKKFKIALFSPQENVTLYVCNLADGWISLFENIVRMNKFDAYFFRSTLSNRAEYEIFEMIAWRGGTLKRQLRALQDDTGWEFLNEGVPLHFEEAARYKERRIRARLDARLLDRYSEAAGYKISGITRFAYQCRLFWRGK